MPNYPLGATDRNDNDAEPIGIEKVRYEPGTFEGTFVGEVIPRGTVLGRITATGKLRVSRAPSGDGSNVPIGVLPNDLTTVGPGLDTEILYIASGRVRLEKLIRTGPGGGVNETVQLQLRTVGIGRIPSTELTKLDN